MKPDIRIKDYYLTFITTAERDITTYKQEIEYYNKVKDKQKEYLDNNKDKLINEFKINIDDENNSLERAKSLIVVETNAANKFLISQVVKYYTTLNKITEYNKMIILATKRKNMKFRQYESYVSAYYNKVHKFVLLGYGYKYNFGLGTLCICRWKLKECNRLSLDYDATNKKKKELLALGKKIWNKLEADWYALRGIPYDGIDYRVYRKESHYYQIDIYKSKLFNHRNHTFKHTEYVNAKFKGMSYRDLADICNNIDDISNLPVDIKYKLNIYLYKDPSNYIRYIRNDEQDRNKYGAHNSKDRQ